MSVAGSLIACPPTPSEYSTALDDAHGLALRPWQRPRRDDRQLDAQADRLLETIGDAAPERRDLRVLQAEPTAAGDQLGRRLDLDLEPRQRGGAVDHEVVVRHELLDAQERALDLGGIEVHALDHQHVVRAALDPRHPHRGAAAAAGPRGQRADVAGAVANERRRALGERGQRQLTLGARRQAGAGGRVDDLRQEVIVGDVQARALLALAGDAGPDDLGEAVGIEGAEAEGPLERLAHALGPRLGAEHPDAQPELGGLAPLLHQRFGEVEGEGRRRGEHVGTEILEQQVLARGVAGRRRHDGHADPLGAGVEAEPAREETVAQRHVKKIAAPGAGGGHHSRHHLAPDVEVTRGVGGDRRLAPGARGRVDARDLLAIDCQKPERIVLAQVALVDEGQLDQLREPADGDAAQPVPVKRHARDGPRDRLAEALDLQTLARLARHRLGLAVPDHGGGSSNPCSRRKRWISSRISRSAIGGTTSRATSRTMRSTAARTSSSPARATEVPAARPAASRAAPSPGSPNPCDRSAVRIASSSAVPLSWSSSSAPSTGTSAGALCPSRRRKNTETWRKCGAALSVRTTSTPETPAPGKSGSMRTTLTSSWSRTARRTSKLAPTASTFQPACRRGASSCAPLADAPSAIRTRGGPALTYAPAAGRRRAGAARGTADRRSGDGGVRRPRAGSAAPRAPPRHGFARARSRRAAVSAPRRRWRLPAPGRRRRPRREPAGGARRRARAPRLSPARSRCRSAGSTRRGGIGSSDLTPRRSRRVPRGCHRMSHRTRAITSW